MAKNTNTKTTVAKIKRSLNEPYMPYLAENKLDAALYELRQSQIKVKSLQIKVWFLMAVTTFALAFGAVYGF